MRIAIGIEIEIESIGETFDNDCGFDLDLDRASSYCIAKT